MNKMIPLVGVQTCNAGVFRTNDAGIKTNAILNTDGNGYWSNVSRKVRITALSVPYTNEENDFGELRVYFDTRTWKTEKHGLIYTDKLFLTELRKYLTSIGLCGKDVSYSEQGMQGDNYVSLDIGEKFIKSWLDIR